MGWSAWALDNLWLVAGGSLVVSFILHLWTFLSNFPQYEESLEAASYACMIESYSGKFSLK